MLTFHIGIRYHNRMENTQTTYTDKELSETARTARKYIKRDHPGSTPHMGYRVRIHENGVVVLAVEYHDSLGLHDFTTAL